MDILLIMIRFQQHPDSSIIFQRLDFGSLRLLLSRVLRLLRRSRAVRPARGRAIPGTAVLLQPFGRFSPLPFLSFFIKKKRSQNQNAQRQQIQLCPFYLFLFVSIMILSPMLHDVLSPFLRRLTRRSGCRLFFRAIFIYMKGTSGTEPEHRLLFLLL